MAQYILYETGRDDNSYPRYTLEKDGEPIIVNGWYSECEGYVYNHMRRSDTYQELDDTTLSYNDMQEIKQITEAFENDDILLYERLFALRYR